MKRSISELQESDIDSIIDYFLKADHKYLNDMGVNPAKLPSRNEWRNIISEDLSLSLQLRQFYYLIWALDDVPIGHSNINKIVYGYEAFMHLHIWVPAQRMRGNGTYFIKKSIFKFFETFDLRRLFCEPYALNPGPNRILQKMGFEFVKYYDTTPGWINFHQPVNRWMLTREVWLEGLASNAQM
jgi:RimJ/RimL family protein N-acetyltransferase